MNLEYLNNRIELSRIPITAIAEGLGISRQSVYNKMKGERDFTTNEVTKLCELLRLTDQEKRIIFIVSVLLFVDYQKLFNLI